jgi:dsRNA-specific ribonuclease
MFDSVLSEFRYYQRQAFYHPSYSDEHDYARAKLDDLWIKLSEQEREIVQDYERLLWIDFLGRLGD